MLATLFLVIRLLAAWTVAIIVAAFLWSGLFNGMRDGPGWFFGMLVLLTMVGVAISIASHVRRVWMISGTLDRNSLSSRQRRRIEVPVEADEAFEMISATLRELPRSEQFESARDSLQASVRIRKDGYDDDKPVSRWNVFARLAVKRNQVLATITPGDGSSSINLVAGPDADAWTDLFLLDDGTNLQAVEAVTRAITRRVAERRRSEQAARERTETEKELTVAKLSLLHAQVEPHFLYNTLASAQYLTRSDPARADEMLGNLIHYLRHSLPRTDDLLATLGDELERTRAYLDIMRIRMGGRLNLQIEVPEPLKAQPFPTMMLQTLVENAIKHGLEPKSGGGTVWIIAREMGDAVAVTVADDGQGFNDQSSGTGIGLKNVRERLRLAYGDAASFGIVSNFPHGVAATISIPATVERIAGSQEVSRG